MIEFFNTKAFVPAPFVPDGGLIEKNIPVPAGATIFGSLGRNILRGPDQRDFGITVIKTTPVTECINLIFRLETFNVLNRSNPANPSDDVSSPSTVRVISGLTVNPPDYAICAEAGIPACCVELSRHATMEIGRNRAFCSGEPSRGEEDVLA